MFKKTLSVVTPQRVHQCSGKMQDWWAREVSGSIPGRCNSFVRLFFCSFYLFCSFFFLSSIKRLKAKEYICYLTICHRLKCGVCDTHNSRERFLTNFILMFLCIIIIWATSWENLFMPYANNKGADQHAHSPLLLYDISSFYIRNFKPN